MKLRAKAITDQNCSHENAITLNCAARLSDAIGLVIERAQLGDLPDRLSGEAAKTVIGSPLPVTEFSTLDRDAMGRCMRGRWKRCARYGNLIKACFVSSYTD